MSDEQEDLGKYVKMSDEMKALRYQQLVNNRVKEDLRISQDTTLFYQSRFTAADQIVRAVKEGSVKTPSSMPDFIKDKRKMDVLHNLCKLAVYANWNNGSKASTLYDIWNFVRDKIHDAFATGAWNNAWTIPGKRTVDRRTNETADVRCWPDGVTPIIAIKAGLYMPNPALFESEVKLKLEAMARRLGPRR